MADQPAAPRAMAEHLAEHLGESTAELLLEAREARAKAKATRERAALVVAASRQAWSKRQPGGSPSPLSRPLQSITIAADESTQHPVDTT